MNELEDADELGSSGESEEDAAQNAEDEIVQSSKNGTYNRYRKELGRGAYKIVYRGLNTDTGREVAWNTVNLNRLPVRDRPRIKKEINLLRQLAHINIIKFEAVWYDKESSEIHFITELITGGSLRTYIKRNKIKRLRVIKTWCRQILEGLNYLHE